MKMKLFHLMVVIGLFTLVQGCNNSEPTSPTTLNTTLKTGTTYQYDLGYFGDEEGVNISTPPNHFQVSKIDRDINSGKIIYTYVPSSGFTGTDTVELKLMRGSNGSSANNNITTVVIKFTIID